MANALVPSKLACSSSDEVEVSGAAQSRRPAAKRTNVEVLEEGGQKLTLAFLVGKLNGRWRPELHGEAKACKAARQSASKAAKDYNLAGLSADIDRVVGVAIVRGWRCVRGAASHADTYALMKASEAFHKKRSGHRFLEHEIIDAAFTQAADNTFLHVPSDVVARPASISGRQILQQLLGARAVAVPTKGRTVGSVLSLGALLDAWTAEYGVARGNSLAWPVVGVLAAAMASGTWYGDVSVRHRRQLPLDNTLAPLLPSIGQMRQFVLMDVDLVQPPEGNLASGQVWDEKKGTKNRFHPEHVLASLRAGQNLGDKAKLKDQLLASLRFWHPQSWQAMCSRLQPTRIVPHKSTYRRSVVKTDLAAMLARRAWYAANGPTYRYLAYDASPQRGLEFFATVERVVRRGAVQAAVSSGQLPAVEARVLPLAMLGSGRMGLAEKLQAHIHQVWLEYGPAAADVRKANCDVRQCLSDMGTELGIADARDVVAECIGQQDEGGASDADVGYLYPLAMVVPGPQHIIDTATQRSLEALPWWPDWQRSAKAMCQWLRGAGHRQLLQERLRAAAGGQPDVVQEQVRSLNTSCDSFAQWRWKTLATVTRDLARKASAVVAACSGIQTASELSSRDGGAAATFLTAAQDPQFWTRVSALSTLVAPMASFSAWIRGCDCHETERLAGKVVQCDWSGCRASRLASRLGIAFEELDNLRSQFSGMPDGPDMVRAASCLLASLRMKMDWLEHEPYLIWQAAVIGSMAM